jgi:hypothetical protein
MSDLKTIREIAKETLITHIFPDNSLDCLWDRAQRLVRNTECVCRLPELNQSSVQIDRFCLKAATYFNDAGAARYLNTHKKQAKAVNFETGGINLLEISAEIAVEKLNGILDPQKIGKISKIINESGNRFAKRLESMILYDVRNLDDMGSIGILNEFRGYVLNGEGISELLQNWKRKIDYKYWQARLRESFRFDSIRKIAETRLSAAEDFMNRLESEIRGDDLRLPFTDPVSDCSLRKTEYSGNTGRQNAFKISPFN